MEHEAVTPNYEPPCIEERTPIGLPLVGAGFPTRLMEHEAVTPVYEPPRIEARHEIGAPLVGGAASPPPPPPPDLRLSSRASWRDPRSRRR